MCKDDSEIWVVALWVTSLLSAVWRGLGKTLDHDCYMLSLLIQKKGSNTLLDASWLEQIQRIIRTVSLMPDTWLRLPRYLRSCVLKFRGCWNIHSLRPALFGKAEESNSDPLSFLDVTCYQKSSAIHRLHFRALAENWSFIHIVFLIYTTAAKQVLCHFQMWELKFQNIQKPC